MPKHIIVEMVLITNLRYNECVIHSNSVTKYMCLEFWIHDVFKAIYRFYIKKCTV